MSDDDSLLEDEKRLREQICLLKNAGNHAEALRTARKLMKLEREIDALGSGNHTEDYGRTGRDIRVFYGSPQRDNFSENSNP